MDFGDYGGHKFLVSVDLCSGWQFVQDLGRNALTHQLIDATRNIFCHIGVSNTLWTDGGPQFRANAFQAFLKQWGGTRRLSSPVYPRSNGRDVKVTKKLIRRCWDPQQRQLDSDLWAQGVLQHRNTPGPDGRSPPEILYGHPVRDMLPAHRRNFAAEWQISADRAEAAAARRQERIEQRYDAQQPTARAEGRSPRCGPGPGDRPLGSLRTGGGGWSTPPLLHQDAERPGPQPEPTLYPPPVRLRHPRRAVWTQRRSAGLHGPDGHNEVQSASPAAGPGRTGRAVSVQRPSSAHR